MVSTISFREGATGFGASIETAHLLMEPIREEDSAYCVSLFEETSPKARDKREDMVRLWIRAWRDGNPFSGFTVTNKETRELFGVIVLEPKGPAGVAHLTYLVKDKNEQHVVEAISALVKDYAPRAAAKGYLVDGKPLAKIMAPALSSDDFTCRRLEEVGLHIISGRMKDGIMHRIYSTGCS